MALPGCHVSIARGYEAAARAAYALGAASFQYFPKNPRSLALKKYDASDAARCSAFCRQHGLQAIAHAPYPTNLAARAEQQPVVAASLRNDLEIAEACGSLGVVVHFGVYKEADPLVGYKRVIELLNTVLGDWKGQARLLLENQSGAHGNFGSSLVELDQIRRLTHVADQIGFCLDTCHLFVSGQWSDGLEPAGAADLKGWLSQARKLHMLDAVKAIHFNDAAASFGSRLDRHAELLLGKMGEQRLRHVLLAPELQGLPFILETPAGSDGTHRSQLALMRSWLAG